MAEILVVDDESSMRFLLRMTFELAGSSTSRRRANGLAAIQRVEGGRVPDLVATDFMMPLMNGGELIARLRRNPATAAIPIILVSSSPGSERRTDGGRVLPQAVRPRRAHAVRGAAPGRAPVMERLTTGDAGLDLVLGGGLPGRFADRRRGAARAAARRSSPSRSASRTRPPSGRRSTTRPGRSRTTRSCGISSRSRSSTLDALGDRRRVPPSRRADRQRREQAGSGPPPTRSCGRASSRSRRSS